MHVSWRKGKQNEHQAPIRKFLDRSKDSLKRLKALKLGLERSSAIELKEFYTKHSTDVFYVVYGSFTILETTIQDKLVKKKGYNDVMVKELMELVLPQFQQVLISLPELIHQKWQFNSICLIIRKLLHPENHIKLRQCGVQLLVLWVQALQENAGDPCMELFASLIPHFPPQKTPMGLPLNSPTASATGGISSGLGERYGVYSRASASWGLGSHQSHLHRSSSAILLGSASSPSREVVCSNILIPLVPASPDPPSSHHDQHHVSDTEQLMTCLLDSLTEQTCWLHWEQPGHYLRGFAHLFFLFKLFYLACLYKDFRNKASLYTPPSPPLLEPTSSCPSSDGLDSLIEEAADGSLSIPPPPSDHPSPKYKRKRGDPYRMSSVIKLEYDLSHPVYTQVQNLVVLYILRWFSPSSSEHLKGSARSGGSLVLAFSDPGELGAPNGAELMRQMWFTTRDNVSLLLEICRQGFTTLTDSAHKRALIDLYRHWIQVPEKPLFMLSPRSTASPSSCMEDSEEDSETVLEKAGAGRAASPAVQSWEQLSKYEGFKMEEVGAGMAASLCMMIAHTQQVFLLESNQDLKVQTELCRKVIRIYQDMAVSWLLDNSGWEYLLSVLLHHTHKLLTHKDTTLGYNLANAILKTLLVCFLRMSVVTDVSPSLWDKLLQVLQSLTHWKEVIVQWKAVMVSMTEVLAQAVYNLKLGELPLDHLALGFQRPRTVSMGRNSVSSHREIAPPRLSSFSALFRCPPNLHLQDKGPHSLQESRQQQGVGGITQTGCWFQLWTWTPTALGHSRRTGEPSSVP